jgi:hypothetical protein
MTRVKMPRTAAPAREGSAGTGYACGFESGSFCELVDLIGRKQETDRAGSCHGSILTRHREKHLSGV